MGRWLITILDPFPHPLTLAVGDLNNLWSKIKASSQGLFPILRISFLPAHAAHAEDLRDPDEDVDGVRVDGDGVVDRVVEGHAVLRRGRVPLGAVQDLKLGLFA